MIDKRVIALSPLVDDIKMKNPDIDIDKVVEALGIEIECNGISVNPENREMTEQVRLHKTLNWSFTGFDSIFGQDFWSNLDSGRGFINN